MKELKQSTAGFEDTRRQTIYELLKKRYDGKDIPDYYIRQEVDYYIGQMKHGNPLLTVRPQEELTNAETINEEMKEFDIDIHTVFHQLDHVGKRINQHQKLNESIINDVRVRINKTEEKLQELGYRLRNNAAHSVFYESFIDYKSRETDSCLYTERTGEEVAPAFHLTIDPYQKALKLPMVHQENKLVNFAGVRLANIHITKQLGSGFIRTKNPEHSIEKAIDTSMETYWNESILTDEPIEVNLGLDYYGIDFGAACEVEVVFDYLTKVNELTLTPFTEYPLDVVSILVYDNDNDDHPFELVSPTAVRKNAVSTDIISYQFQEVVAKRIKILLNQRHYVKKDLIMNVDDKTLVDAWLKNQNNITVDAGRLFKPIEQDQIDQHPFWTHMKEYMKNKNIVDELSRYADVDFSNKIHLSKYEYQYGLYNLAANYNEYMYEGVYVTKPVTNTSVHLVQLEAEEDHPIMEKLLMPVTNIEYYVTDIEDPKEEDWFSLLPLSTKEILSERLYPEYKDGEYTAQSRFDVDRFLAVRGNGERLLPNKEYKVSGRRVILLNFDPSRIYTIDYKPLPSAYTVDFMERYTTRTFDTKQNHMIEKIETKKNMEDIHIDEAKSEVELSYFPFIDKNELNKIEQLDLDWNPTYLSNEYLPFKLKLILPGGEDISQAIDVYDTTGIFVVNRTDYYDTNRSLLEPFNGINYQYRVEKNKLKFNTELPAGTQIAVEYPYLTGPIRMKIIMRRNLHEVEGLTPFLHEYKLIFQSLV